MMRSYEQMVRFIAVGSLNSFVGYTLFAFFVYIGMRYPLAVLCATCLGVLFNFKSTGHFVFQSNNHRLFRKFVVVYGVSYGFNCVCIKGLLLLMGNVYVAGFFAMIPTAIITFLLNKQWVFRDVYAIN